VIAVGKLVEAGATELAAGIEVMGVGLIDVA